MASGIVVEEHNGGRRSEELLLDIRDLHVRFPGNTGEARALDGVTIGLRAGETLGLVGESGSGKTMTALSILRLVPSPGQIVAGEIRFAGQDLLLRAESRMREIRGNEIAMVFQEPMTSLNPVHTIGQQIAESIRIHERLGRRPARERAIEMLELVEIPEPARRYREYPHQLSGGMRQRVMIAIALSCKPRLLIADEPTTALDVTIQAEILDLLADLQQRLGMALLLVTHDLGVVAERADRIAIMYAGRIIEQGPVAGIFREALHPYTRGLLRSVPGTGGQPRRRLEMIPGSVPDLSCLPRGCRFRDRCGVAVAACAESEPEIEEIRPGHYAACLRAGPNLRGEPTS